MHPKPLNRSDVAQRVVSACAPDHYRGKRILLIVPDGTRTAPIGLVFETLYQHVGHLARSFDVLIALGTHQPMSQSAICRRLDITEDRRQEVYSQVHFFNHAWDNPAALRQIGSLAADEVSQLTGGRFAMDVPVEINKL